MENTEVQTQDNGAEPAEPTIDSVKADFEARLKEKEGRIAGLNRKVNKYKTDLDTAKVSNESSNSRMIGIERVLAEMNDKLAVQNGEEATAVKKLEAEASKTPDSPATNPDADNFVKLVNRKKLLLDWDDLDNPDNTDPIVNEAIKAGGDNALIALTALEDALDVKREADISARITNEVQQRLKENGMTVNGAESVKAGGSDDEEFKRLYALGDSNDHARAMKLRDNLK